jgi:hypothetical protein
LVERRECGKIILELLRRRADMNDNEYLEALKLGKKEYKYCLSQGRFPYLPVLDDILSTTEIQTEQPLGLVQVPLNFVVGTSTKGNGNGIFL